MIARVAWMAIWRHVAAVMRTPAVVSISASLICASASVGSPLIIAHRGASEDAPENTLAALHLAWEQGADGIEVDLHLTKDGHVVCIHDADTKKVAGKKLIVRDSTLEELRQLDVGVLHDARFRGERIPTLEEVLEIVPADKLVYLDIKCGVEIIDPVLAILEGSALSAEQVVFLAFDAGLIRTLKDKAPQYKAHWLCRVRKGRFFGGLRPTVDEVKKMLRESGADGLASRHSDISDDFITTVIAAGYEHHVWTVNQIDLAARFAKLGTTSIITDAPARIKNHFTEDSP
jgi:glycerophosphoryl diester phosphodiesterase